MNLHPKVYRGVEKSGFTECTEIQEGAMPLLLDGKDVAGLAQTGTGKTAAFLLPLMDRVLRDKEPVGDAFDVRAFKEFKASNFILILVPTRELAEQVYENFKSLGAETGLTAVAIYGGTSYDPQTKALHDGVDFVIATPGRLIDLFKDHHVDLGQVRAVVFDEADRMFDMGFKDDMKFILRRIPRDRQFLVFSATLNFEVLEVAYEHGSHPVEINVSRDQAKADNVKDELFHVGHFEKAKYLLALFKKYEPKQAIVFSNFRLNVERVAEFLSKNGYPAMGISSLLTQSQRLRVMNLFREENDKNILVATDLAARGLDIKGVDLVINFELPDDPENYVHRIGRTGRAGATGKAMSLVSDRDVEALGRIESFLEHKVEIGWLEDQFITDDFKPFPSDRDKRGFKKGDGKDSRRDSGQNSGRPGGRNDGPRGHGGRPDHRSGQPRRDHARSDQPRRDDRPRRDDQPRANQARSDQPRSDQPRTDNQPRRNDFRNKRQDQGRHQGARHQAGRNQEGRQTAGHQATGRQGSDQRRDYKSGQRPRPYKHRPQVNSKTNVAQTGIAGRIKGLFKKLFGADVTK